MILEKTILLYLKKGSLLNSSVLSCIFLFKNDIICGKYFIVLKNN